MSTKYPVWSDRPQIELSSADLDMAMDAYRYALNHRLGEEVAVRNAIESAFILAGYRIKREEDDTSSQEAPPSP